MAEVQECDLLDPERGVREAASGQLQGWLAECLGAETQPPEAQLLAKETHAQIGEWLAVQAANARVTAEADADQLRTEVSLASGKSHRAHLLKHESRGPRTDRCRGESSSRLFKEPWEVGCCRIEAGKCLGVFCLSCASCFCLH